MLPAATILCLAALAARAPEPPGTVVAKVLSAYGGRAALERAGAIREEGTVTSKMRGTRGKLLRIFARPRSLRVEISYPGEAPEVRILHARRGERDGVPVTGPPYDAMVLQAARLDLPLALVGEGAHVIDRGEAERDGRRARVLALSLSDGMELVVEIDPASHRILRSSGTLPTGGGRMEFVTVYSRFETFGGLLFATHEENYAGGFHTGTTTLEKIAVLSKAPDGAFGDGP